MAIIRENFCSVLFVVLLLSPLPLLSAPRKVPTVTLLVKKYNELEASLAEGILQGNRQAIRAFLAPDFEERRKDSPNDPIPRERWVQLQHERTHPALPVFSQMAVRKTGDVFIVSFLEKREAGTVLVVDVWKKTSGVDQLIARYQS